MHTDILLHATKALLLEKEAQHYFDSYAIFAKVKGKTGAVFSENTNEDTLFDIASCGKVFVTTPLAFQAFGEGKLHSDDTLDKFFKNIPEDIRAVKISHLLSHGSGIVKCVLRDETAAEGRASALEQIFSTPRAFPPGTQYQYSCMGMILLGFILEDVYGKSLEALFEERIKAPLGFTRSKFNVALDEPNTAKCHHWFSTEPYPYAHPWDDENVRALRTASGNGGQFFSLADICKYADAIMAKDPRLYHREFFDLAERDYHSGHSHGYGLGFRCVDARYPEGVDFFSKGTFGHGGSTGTSFYYNRTDDACVYADRYAPLLRQARIFLSIYKYVCQDEARNLHGAPRRF
ncbi:MAG: beta-lactamase family protein [Clostridia bacterium]|nr:beta-lactamase family protein [Clostridia bacterium]